MSSRTRELIEIRLGATKRKSLTGLVRQGRQAGHGWRKIADVISRESGIPVSHTTIARWFDPSPSQVADRASAGEAPASYDTTTGAGLPD